MKVFKKNLFNQYLIVKKTVIIVFGLLSYPRYADRLKIKGSENLKGLPDRNVLFVANHHTHFGDVIAILHVFYATLNGRKDNLNRRWYILRPKLNIYFVAAKETMRKGILPRIFAYAGSISIERTWREAGKAINRPVKLSDVQKVKEGLQEGWVILFPQGTTKDFSPVREGSTHFIKSEKPVVVPLVLKGFREAYTKSGLITKDRTVEIAINIKKQLDIDYENATTEELVDLLGHAIEQHPSMKPKLKKKPRPT
ncbi:MAG: lysophospholipid acyltransferase family protein [Flavobacteriaceae bacterium]|nr:lysophospholipid acyltransferase family protein [Flavobacteriaceae bacterium]MCY4254339.1 lysophospholipid acyltransferase family protein [Flavobacteriaceae bacterium]